MSDHLRYVPEYFEAVRARLMKGAVVYEDRSFSKDPADLLEELRQEALDLAGWGFVLYCRLQAMSEALEASATPTRLVSATVAETPNSAEYRGVCLVQAPSGGSSTARADSQPPRRMVGADRVAS